jgi:dynein intermediate chain 2
MAEFFIYQKKRREFGKPCNFQETDTRHCGYFPTPGQVTTYKERNPNFISLDNISELSEHQVRYKEITLIR